MSEEMMKKDKRIARKIGAITYLVGVHFNENATENLADKLKRMMKTECESQKSV